MSTIAHGSPAGARYSATRSIGFCVADRPIRRGGAGGERLQTLQAESEVGAALRADHRMDLVDDHRLHGMQHPPAAVGGEQQIQRLRRGHQDVGRTARHRRTHPRGGVAGPHHGTDRCEHLLARARRVEQAVDAGQRLLQVAVDVVAERLQGRDVQDRGRLGQRAVDRSAHQTVDRREERGQRLAGTGGRGDQGVPAVADLRPGALLDLGGSGKGFAKPGGDRRMEPLQRISLPPVSRVGAVHGVQRHKTPASRGGLIRPTRAVVRYGSLQTAVFGTYSPCSGPTVHGR